MFTQYFKITNAEEKDSKGFQYVDGLNEWKGKFVKMNMENKNPGISFTTADQIHRYYHHGCYLRLVEVPITNPDFVMLEDNGLFWANMVVLKDRYPLSDLGTYNKFGLKMIDFTYAASQGYFDVVKYLVENGSVIDEANCSPLKWSAHNGHLEIVKYLVENGATLCDSAMYHAILNCHLHIIEYLLSRGATYDNCFGAVTEIVNKNRLDVLIYLINNKFDIARYYGYILINASVKGIYDIVKYLLDNIETMATDYNIPLDDVKIAINISLVEAAKHGCTEVVKYLIDAGADVEAADNNALIYSARKGYMDIVKCLVEAGANVYAQSNKAIIMSAKKNHLEVIKYLLQVN